MTTFFRSYYLEAVVLSFIDNLLTRFFHSLLLIAQRVSGHDKFEHARDMLNMAQIQLTLVAFLVTRNNWPRWLPVTISAWCIIWVACRGVRKEIAIIERHEEADSDVFIFTNLHKSSLRVASVLPIVLLAMIDMVNRGWGGLWDLHFPGWNWLLAFWGSIAFSGAIFWATDVQPPRKNIFRRALDWLKAHKPNFSLGGTAPHPIPS